MIAKRVVAALLMLLTFGAFAMGQSGDRDEAVITVQVTSAEHEAQEGYFSLGSDTTVMVKPGTDLFRFLSRHRGDSIKIVLTKNHARELSKIER